MNQQKNDALAAWLSASPIVPVVTISDDQQAPDLARSLLSAGISIIEVTLRTSAAMDAMRRIHDEVPEMLIGAGTVWSVDKLDEIRDAGAKFAVSPGRPAGLARAEELPIPFLPGVQTISEAAALADAGFDILKVFPAGISGGPGFLKAVGSVLPKLRFCPTGGVTTGNLAEYLGLSNVICVGGSWIATGDDIKAGAWDAIESRALEALEIARDCGR